MHVHNAKISVFYDLTSAQLYYQNAEVYSKRGIYVMSEIWDTELKEIYISQAIVCPRYVKIELQFPDKLSKFLILKHNDVVDADIQKHLKTVAKWSDEKVIECTIVDGLHNLTSTLYDVLRHDCTNLETNFIDNIVNPRVHDIVTKYIGLDKVKLLAMYGSVITMEQILTDLDFSNVSKHMVEHYMNEEVIILHRERQEQSKCIGYHSDRIDELESDVEKLKELIENSSLSSGSTIDEDDNSVSLDDETSSDENMSLHSCDNVSSLVSIEITPTNLLDECVKFSKNTKNTKTNITELLHDMFATKQYIVSDEFSTTKLDMTLTNLKLACLLDSVKVDDKEINDVLFGSS